MTRGNQDFQISLKSHPVVLMGDLAYFWVRWSKMMPFTGWIPPGCCCRPRVAQVVYFAARTTMFFLNAWHDNNLHSWVAIA